MKKVKKRVAEKRIPPKIKIPQNTVEKALIENFISLQKVMTNLALKFDNLASQISKLLELFEISAKTLVEKDIKLDKGKDEKKVAEKLDTLLEQNKIIARGLALLHEGTTGELPIPQPAQLMRQPMPPTAFQPTPVKRTTSDGYQKSMSIKSPQTKS